MLTKEQLVGLWVSVPTEWDEAGNFDEKTFRDEVAMLIDVGVNGLYTTGTTGEFYALDWDEYQQVQAAFLAETAGKIPVQVGANWFNTRDTIKRMRFARDHGADAVQICFPGWMEMREVDYDQFLIDCYKAVPDIAIIHYNIARTKKLFFADDYLRVQAKVPSMIGTKAAMPFNNYIDLMSRAPELNHFVGETTFPLAHQLGCKGMYTSWTMMNPTFFKELLSDVRRRPLCRGHRDHETHDPLACRSHHAAVQEGLLRSHARQAVRGNGRLAARHAPRAQALQLAERRGDG